MRCDLEFQGCLGETVTMFKLTPFAKGVPERTACSECWKGLVGNRREYIPEVRHNVAKLPEVKTPPRGAPAKVAPPPLFATGEAAPRSSRGTSR